MTNIDVDDLAQIIRQVDGNHDLGAGALAEAILDRLPAPQIIRTVEEQQALDPDTVVITPENEPTNVGVILAELEHFGWKPCLPAVVVTPAAQARAARKALEEA